TLAQRLAASVPEVAGDCPAPASWMDLARYLAGFEEAGGGAVRCVFPLLLSEVVVQDRQPLQVVLAAWVLESAPGEPGSLSLHPEQLLTRCFDAEFANVFPRAVELARDAPGDGGDRRALRARIQPLRPEHEVFLRSMPLRGPSGAGALAIALSCAWLG